MVAELNNFNIRRIKEWVYTLNESLYIPDPNQLLKIELGVSMGHSIEANVATILVRVFYHYPDAPTTEILVDFQVQNIYEIADLKQFADTTYGIKLPSQLMITLVGISISHTRALLAKSIAGTHFQENLLPYVDPENVTRTFFPFLF